MKWSVTSKMCSDRAEGKSPGSECCFKVDVILLTPCYALAFLNYLIKDLIDVTDKDLNYILEI